jgi:hypothetical protein
MKAPSDNAEFSFIVDGEPTDEAISALAGLLLDIVNHEISGEASPRPGSISTQKPTDQLPKEKAS